MALTLSKKIAEQAAAAPKKGLSFLSGKTQANATTTHTQETEPKKGLKGILGASKSSTPSEPKKTAGSFLKRGAAASEAMAQAEARAEAAKEEAGKLWRFWMPADEERKITFLDGEIGEDGLLDIPMFNEHHIKHNGEWENVMCIADQEPCPICEAGGDGGKQYLCGAMTIIDHTPYTIKSGKNQGKTIVNSRKLFVCSRTTVKLLTKIAMKRGGLTGCTFDVTRTGDKEPSVGNQFDFVDKNSLEDIRKELGLKPEDVTPGVYENELSVKTAEEMVKLGLAKGIKGIGSEKGISKNDLKNEL